MSAMKAVKTARTSKTKPTTRSPNSHRHYCTAHKEKWTHIKACRDGVTLICEDCLAKQQALTPLKTEAEELASVTIVAHETISIPQDEPPTQKIRMPRTPNPDSMNLGEVLGLKPEFPEPAAQEAPAQQVPASRVPGSVPKKRHIQNNTAAGAVVAQDTVAPKTPASAQVDATAQPNGSKTTYTHEGMKIVAWAWRRPGADDHYRPILSIRTETRSYKRHVGPCKPMSEAEALTVAKTHAEKVMQEGLGALA